VLVVLSVATGVGLVAISTAEAASQSVRVSKPATSQASYPSSSQANVPANCIRQECGKLWCWSMNGKH
jgi:hypothetical protein